MAISDKEKDLISRLCENIGKLQTRVLTAKAIQMVEYLHQQVDAEAETQDEAEIEKRLVNSMREADIAFERCGGGTKDYAVNCLMPLLAKHGLKLVSN